MAVWDEMIILNEDLSNILFFIIIVALVILLAYSIGIRNMFVILCLIAIMLIYLFINDILGSMYFAIAILIVAILVMIVVSKSKGENNENS